PLADRMRPINLDELVGQEHLTAKGSLLQKAIEDDRVFSMILWGPPGCGKTTLAGIIANETKSEFIEISAVLSGVKDIRQIIEKAKERRALYKKRTLLFVDEIHRFNKAQQDAFLHHVEKGLIILIGATTQNPSFEVIPALVSRCRVFTLNSLKKENILAILNRALTDSENGLGLEKEKLSD
ncbi:MAG: AAA family ATPase, partial [Desulfobacteraceae bacterium]|nr:AAA family ATPase [Desulfobacteraceae bacterium]